MLSHHIKFSSLLSIILCWRKIRPDTGKTIKNNFSLKWLLKEADSDKTLALLMNRYVCLVASSLTNTLSKDFHD